LFNGSSVVDASIVGDVTTVGAIVVSEISKNKRFYLLYIFTYLTLN